MSALISARGALPMATLLSEVAKGKARACGGEAAVIKMEIERSWAAASKVLRAQLLLGYSVAISPKGLDFYITHKLVRHDGRTKYLLRIPNAAFHPNFITTYGVDTGVPREPADLAPRRLPLDEVAAEARLPPEVVSDCLREVFLFVGEAIFQGRLVLLEFDGVATVLLKRDRMTTHFTDAFLDELYAIDTRKWPLVAKEAGEAVRPRPLRDPREYRPASASSRPASARPRSSSSSARPSSAAAKALENRPQFVANAPRGRTFEEIAEEGPRAVRIQEARLAALHPRPGTPGSARRPLSAKGRQAAAGGKAATLQPTQLAESAPGDEAEDESIYSVLTPHRNRDVAMPDATPVVIHEGRSPNAAYDEEVEVDEVDEEDVVPAQETSREEEPPVVEATAAPASARGGRSAHALNLFGTADDASNADAPRTGRRRVVPPSHAGMGVHDLMQYREPSPTTSPSRGAQQKRRLYDNLLL